MIDAIIFDLGGTLVYWPDWDAGAPRHWGRSYDSLLATQPDSRWPTREQYVEAMLQAEQAHWKRVDAEHWSGPPSSLLHDGFRRLGIHPHENEMMAALDGYARSVDGWALVYPDARSTLQALREHGYRLGLLSNTWWAAEWHNADLAVHGLDNFLDELVYTSDLPHSKPHASVFFEVASRLGVAPERCVMIGDRLLDDVGGAQGAGMRGIWKENDSPWPKPGHVTPDATVRELAEIPSLLESWGGKSNAA